MNSYVFPWLILAMLICAHLTSLCGGDDKSKEGQKSSRARERTMVVRIDNNGDVGKLLDGRTTAIYDCIRVLKEPYDRASSKAKEKRQTAAYLLGTLRASDHQEAVELLVKNLTFHSHIISFSEDHPLLGFSAAEAIAEIGSPALGELLKSVAPERTDDELRLVAFIIERVDGRELGLCRIELELNRVLRRWPELRDAPDAQVKNLRQIQKWFSDAQFFEKEENWPYRSRSTK